MKRRDLFKAFAGGVLMPLAPAATAAAAAAPAVAAAGKGAMTVINIEGAAFDASRVRELIDRINEENRAGGRVVLS